MKMPFFTRSSLMKNFYNNVFYQVTHYGKQDISVLAAVTESLKIAAEMVMPCHHEALWKVELYLLEGVETGHLKSLDREFLQRKIDELAAAVNRRPVNLKSANDK